MKVAVTDANIFIDLIILQLVDQLFLLNIEIHTTREVFDQLREDQKAVLEAYLPSGKLTIYNFNAEEIEQIAQLEMPKGLEPADRTVYYYAHKIQSLVLSGDNKLRKFCISKKLKVCGIIWLFDEFVAQELISPVHAKERLEHLLGYNDRVPMEECLKRLSKWGTKA